MKNLWNIVKYTSMVIGIFTVLFGFTSTGYNLYYDIVSRIFDSVETKEEAQKFHEEVPYDKWDKENLFDSIKDSEDAKWKANQEKRLDEFERLLRLNIMLSDQTKKKTDTLNQNLEHTLEHVDQ